MRKQLRLSEFTGKEPQKLPRKSCDVGLRCEVSACFFKDRAMRNACDSDSLRSGLRREHPRCQITGDVGRAMRTTKSATISCDAPYTTIPPQLDAMASPSFAAEPSNRGHVNREAQPWTERSAKNHEGETHPKNSPTQIKAQFAQTISGQFVQTVPPFSL